MNHSRHQYWLQITFFFSWKEDHRKTWLTISTHAWSVMYIVAPTRVQDKVSQVLWLVIDQIGPALPTWECLLICRRTLTPSFLFSPKFLQTSTLNQLIRMQNKTNYSIHCIAFSHFDMRGQDIYFFQQEIKWRSVHLKKDCWKKPQLNLTQLLVVEHLGYQL